MVISTEIFLFQRTFLPKSLFFLNSIEGQNIHFSIIRSGLFVLLKGNRHLSLGAEKLKKNEQTLIDKKTCLKCYTDYSFGAASVRGIRRKAKVNDRCFAFSIWKYIGGQDAKFWRSDPDFSDGSFRSERLIGTQTWPLETSMCM